MLQHCPNSIILVPKGHLYTPEFDLVTKELGGEKVRVWRRKVEDECKHYLKTGIDGSYETAGIVDTMLDDMPVPLFEDTELIEQPDSICLERHMDIVGKRFVVRSVFPKTAASLPTDKLLSLIDKEQGNI
jgi:hypothetical protein